MFTQTGSGRVIRDRGWSTKWRALSTWNFVCIAWTTALCHRSVTRTTTVLLTRRASSTPTIPHSSPTRVTWSLTSPGAGGVRSSAVLSKRHNVCSDAVVNDSAQRHNYWDTCTIFIYVLYFVDFVKCINSVVDSCLFCLTLKTSTGLPKNKATLHFREFLEKYVLLWLLHLTRLKRNGSSQCVVNGETENASTENVSTRGWNTQVRKTLVTNLQGWKMRGDWKCKATPPFKNRLWQFLLYTLWQYCTF